MSLKINIVATYASQIYVTLLSILVIPMYLHHMGAEAYGLVGFFVMLQAWFQLLDLGLSSTIARESTRYYSGITDTSTYLRLVRALQLIFFIVALLAGSAMFLSADWLAINWLNVQLLPLKEVVSSIQLMAPAVAMRWIAGLYRGCVTGAERLVWLSIFNATIASLRFGGILPILIYIDATPISFFLYQALISALELCGLAFKVHRLTPRAKETFKVGWSLGYLIGPIIPTLKFSLSIAFTSSIWVLVTQTDKLLLSKIIPLTEYGYFTLAALVGGGVLLIGGPISTAVMPRMVRLAAENNEEGLIRLYHESTQMVVIFTAAATLMLGFFAEPILMAWTGDKNISAQVAPILILYSVGNGILAISGVAYMLQYAVGNLKMHVIGSLGFFAILMPAIVWGALDFGAVGAGYAWVFSNTSYLVFWIPFVHKKIYGDINKTWFLNDIIRIYAACFLVVGFLRAIAIQDLSRIQSIVQIVTFGLIAVFASALISPFVMLRIKSWSVR